MGSGNSGEALRVYGPRHVLSAGDARVDSCLRSVFLLRQEAAFFADAQGVIFCFNPAAAALGLGEPGGPTTASDFGANLARAFAACASGGGPQRAHQKWDERWYDVSIVPAEVEEGSAEVIGVTLSDITRHRLNEEALRLSEARYTTTLEALNEGVWEWEVATGRGFFSPRYYTMLGYEPGEFPADFEQFQSLIHPDDRGPAMDMIRAKLDRGDPDYALEFRMRNKSGDWTWIGTRGRVVARDHDGRPALLVGLHVDITERRAMQEALRRSEELHRALFDASRDAIIVADLETRRPLYANPAACAMLGWSEAEFTELTLPDLHPSICLDEILALFESMAKGERDSAIDVPLRRKEGVIVKADVRSFLVDIGGRKCIAGAFRFQEDAKLAERAIALGDMLLATFIENTPHVAIEGFDGAGRIRFWNGAAETLFGVPAKDAIGKTFAELGVAPDAECAAFRAEIGRLAAGGKPSGPAEHRMARADGTPLCCLATACRLPTLAGDPVFVRMDIDVTARREAEEEVRRAREAAESADRAKSEFLAVISHELRTPLNPIIGLADLLALSVENPKHLEWLRLIRGSATHLLNLISGILDFTRAEAGRMEVNAGPTHLPKLVDELVRAFRVEAMARGITVRVRPSTGVPDIIQTDPQLLRQVLSNLVANAVKFTASGSVEVRMARPPTLPGEPGRVPLEISVIDTGPGLPSGRVEEMFNPFVQADSSVTRCHGGAGLGLAISRRIAQLLGGTLTAANNDPGPGATFTFAFEPLAEVPDPRAPNPPPQPAPALPPGTRVLVVEDDPTNRVTLEAMLDRQSFQIRTAESGPDAVAAFAVDRPDIILMDVRIPGFDGLETTRRIRAMGSPQPVILGVTANALPEDRAACLDAGMDGYLAKPFSRSMLLDAMIGVFDRRR